MDRKKLLWASALVALTGVAPAFAQESEGRVAEIVVTAERRAANLQEVPIAVTAFTSGTLENLGVNVINDLAAIAPNLTSTTGPQGSADANFFVRGVGQFDFIVTNDPGVGVYVDGVYLGRTVGAMLDSGDIERVEVLRGPQGTLFGRNTLGGAISVTSKAPELGEFGGDAEVTVGERERLDLQASLNVPLGDKAAARVYAFTREQEGFATSFDGRKFGATEREGGKIALRIEPTSTFTIDVSADYSLDQSNPAPSVLLAAAPLPFFPPAIFADIQNPSDFYQINASNSTNSSNEVWGLNTTLTWDLGAATVKSISAYRSLNGFSTSDPDGTRFRLYDQATTTDQDQFSQELQVSGDAFGDRLEYVVGAYYFLENAEQVLDLCFAPLLPAAPTAPFNPCNVWSQGNDQETTSYALFGQGRFNLTEKFSVTLGGRYTEEEKDIISNQAFDFTAAGVGPFLNPGLTLGDRVRFPIVNGLKGNAEFNKFTPKVGVEYQVNEDILLFASYAEGFRSGGFNGRLIAPQTSIPTYAPDTNDAYEAGVKSDLLDGRLRVNATVFHSIYDGIQQTISDPNVQFRVANAGEAELTGAEIEITAAPTAELLINAAIGYTDSEFKNVPASVGPVNGNQLPFSPEFTGSVGVSYDFALGGFGVLTPRVNYRYQTEQYFTAFNLPLERQEEYGLLSARLTWTDASERVSVSVFGENITDEEYYTFGQSALTQQGVAYNYIGRPSEWGLTARVNF